MLVTWPTEFPSSDDTRAAIGIWMIDDSSSPPRPVRLFITYGALWHLHPQKIRDAVLSLDIFNEKRDFIEAIASDEFDEYGAADDDFYEGQAVVWIYPADVERALAVVSRPQAPTPPPSAAPIRPMTPAVERPIVGARNNQSNAFAIEQVGSNANPCGR
jgi:hypothetical protein